MTESRPPSPHGSGQGGHEIVIRLIDTSTPLDALGNTAPLGYWLKSYNPEAHDGQGDAEFTDDLEDALVFSDAEAAIKTYRAIPNARPWRDDAKPNRPLTACTVEFIRLDDARAERDG